MLTSKQITDAIAQDPNHPSAAGKVAYLRRSLKSSMGVRTDPASHYQFADDLAAQHTPGAPGAEPYRHPGNDPKAHAPGRGGTPLSPSDLAWIGRLPSDPTKMPYDDAVQLAGLSASLAGTQHASDARLVDSVWKPVQEVHDAGAARVALDQAQRSVPDVPSSAVRALADSIAAEVPNLQPAEALSRAGTQLREALDKRATVRQQKVLDARAAIARASEAASLRTATTR